MTAWLTQNDVDAYGTELIDLTQRSALHALAPTLQNLEQANAELRQRLAIEARRNLDQRVAAAVPDYQQIDRDPRWHQWLRAPDPLSGVPRQQLLNDAIASGSATRVRAFFEGFRQEVGGTQSHASARTTSRTRSASSPRGRVYTRAEIAQLYEHHRKGAYAGRDAEWQRLEYDIIRAGAEGRVLNPVDVTGK
jgi:hypothetical protein